MDLSPIIYNSFDYIETSTGKIIAKNAKLSNPENIIMIGKAFIMDNCKIIDEFISIENQLKIGSNLIMKKDSIFIRSNNKENVEKKEKIGSYVHIGERSIINSSLIGSYVYIGNDEENCCINDCCLIYDGSRLIKNSIFPPYSIIGGNPAKKLNLLPECYEENILEFFEEFFKNLKKN